jgi:hypothetical protein
MDASIEGRVQFLGKSRVKWAADARFREVAPNPRRTRQTKPGSSGAENVVDFEGLVDLVEPFDPVGGPAAAALIQWQLELAQ